MNERKELMLGIGLGAAAFIAFGMGLLQVGACAMASGGCEKTSAPAAVYAEIQRAYAVGWVGAVGTTGVVVGTFVLRRSRPAFARGAARGLAVGVGLLGLVIGWWIFIGSRQ